MKIHRSFNTLSFLIILTCISVILYGQEQVPRFQKVVGSDGISLGKIASIATDTAGVIWLADQTNGCLTRFDGNRMTRYKFDPANPNSLGGTNPEIVTVDSSGIVWIGFYNVGMGMDRFDPANNLFRHFRHDPKDPESLANDTVTQILIDHRGKIWVGTYEGLDLLNPETGKFTHFSHDPSNPASLSSNIIRQLYEDHDGRLWVGTGFPWIYDNNGGLNLFHPETGTFTRFMHDPKNPNSLVDNKVRAIFEDSYGKLWVGTRGDGLHSLDPVTGIITRYPYHPGNKGPVCRPKVKGDFDHITFITEDAERQLWIGTLFNGLLRFDPQTQTSVHYDANVNKNIFPDTSSWAAYPAPDESLWVSTQENQLFRVDLITNQFPDIRLSYGQFFDFYQDDQKFIYFATDSGFVRKNLESGEFKSFRLPPFKPDGLQPQYPTFFRIIKDEHGIFWVGSLNGLVRFDPKTETLKNYENDPMLPGTISNNMVFDLIPGDQDDLWLGTVGGGLNHFDIKTGKFKSYNHDPSDSTSIGNSQVIEILKDKDPDYLWLGLMDYSGISHFNTKTGKSKNYRIHQNINAIYFDSNGILWAGGDDGIFRYSKEQDEFIPISRENPAFALTDVRSFKEDRDHNLWGKSLNGIFRLNRDRNRLMVFGKENGVQYPAVFQSIALLPDGSLVFGHERGYYQIDPRKIILPKNNLRPLFTGLYVNGVLIQPGEPGPLHQPIAQTDSIQLNHNENIFSLTFSLVDFDATRQKEIFYKLENYEQLWRLGGIEGQAYYFNIPPGDYLLRLKAYSGQNGGLTEKTLFIRINPPWWKTWPAYLLFAAIAITIIYFINQYMKMQFLKAEREKTRERELAQAKEIEKAYNDLKSTQEQLIQSEKMASLGEMTAGIAHEIQNPLNFVNNFTEVNRELLDEMKEAIEKGNLEDVKLIANNISDNEEKISHHGKRADSIVKSMLLHSRAGTGQKTPTDMNALVDEYLRLSYHGMRAKDKSFNSGMETNFDPTLPSVSVVPQDMGRVFLNIINNAFHAVNLKSKALHDPAYKPTVTVSTKKQNGKVEINIADNGPGIPDSMTQKIFHPFFTTKAAGQGTGLGLSISYDIVKAHGGEIRIHSKEGEGSEFIIVL